MDNLEKNLLNLPKPNLGRNTDLKIRSKIRWFVFFKNLRVALDLPIPKTPILRPIFLSLLIVAVIFGSTAAYAYANDSVTIGSALYPLKKAVENVQQNLSLTKNSKVDTLNNFSERRLKEAVNLVEENQQNDRIDQQAVASNNIQATIDEAVNNIDSAVKTSQEIVDVKAAQRAKDKIKKKNEAIVQYLDNIEKIADINQNKEVINKVNEAKRAIDKYNAVLDKGNKHKKSDNGTSGRDNDSVQNPVPQNLNTQSDFPKRDTGSQNKSADKLERNINMSERDYSHLPR
ncbi:MAG: DUF5667 domain-containing protein [Patescibacteria group bacterium]